MTSVTSEQFERDSEADDEAFIDETLKSRTGRTVTLQMLLSAGILEPGKDLISIDYLGQKFTADLMPDGKIKHFGSTFYTPSAWALSCKKMISDKKSGCGWNTVKYKGRKLDAYKAIWMKKCQRIRERDSTETDDEDLKPIVDVNKKVYQHNVISNRNIEHDLNTLIECVPWGVQPGKIQPFLVSINNSVMLMIDFHCHLSLNEVCGYLGGDWDSSSNSLTVKFAYPCLNVPQDSDNATECELNIQRAMIKDNVKLVGWYHSHPTFEAHPTLRDIDNQLDYQVALRGTSDATYSPCLGIICSPFDKKSLALDSQIMAFWVVPPSEQKALEYGRPMMMHYTPIPEITLPNDFQQQVEAIVQYYKSFKAILDLNLIFKDKISYFDALKTSMLSRIPQGENKESFWNWLRDLLGIKRPAPPSPEPPQEVVNKKEENPLMRELIEQNNALLPEPVIVEVKEEQQEIKSVQQDSKQESSKEELKQEQQEQSQEPVNLEVVKTNENEEKPSTSNETTE